MDFRNPTPGPVPPACKPHEDEAVPDVPRHTHAPAPRGLPFLQTKGSGGRNQHLTSTPPAPVPQGRLPVKRPHGPRPPAALPREPVS